MQSTIEPEVTIVKRKKTTAEPEVTIIKRKKLTTVESAPKTPKADIGTTREHGRLKHSCVSEGCRETVKWGYEPKNPIACSKHKALCAEIHGKEPFDTYRPYCTICLELYNADNLVIKGKKLNKPIRAAYSRDGDDNPSRCVEHCKPPHVPVDEIWFDSESKKCEGPNETTPCTNGKHGKGAPATIGETRGKPRWCAKCKPKDTETINAFASLCEECGDIASFGKPGEKKATHCGKHGVPLGLIDIKHAKCVVCKKIQPTYGYIDGSPTHCSTCGKTENCTKTADEAKLVDIVNYKCINHAICKKGQPTWGLPGEKAIYCAHCGKKVAGAIDLHHEDDMCKTCGITRINEKFKSEDLCAQCYYRAHPDTQVTRNFKCKELHMRKAIQEIAGTFDWVEVLAEDSIIKGGRSKRRPDYALLCHGHIVVFECDEYKHTGYEEICENKRMMQIFEDCGSNPIIFVRFNPDAYTAENGKKQKSCFKPDKFGKMVIAAESNWYGRRKILKEIAEKAITTYPAKEVTVVHLFYDGPAIQGDILPYVDTEDIPHVV